MFNHRNFYIERIGTKGLGISILIFRKEFECGPVNIHDPTWRYAPTFSSTATTVAWSQPFARTESGNVQPTAAAFSPLSASLGTAIKNLILGT